MRKNKFSQVFNKTVIIALSLLLIVSCDAPSKADVSSRLVRSIRLGATKSEVLDYVDAFEINGIKAGSSGYIKNSMSRTIPVNGKEIKYDGSISIDFRGRGTFYCGAFALFYFDESEKLVNYFVEDIYC